MKKEICRNCKYAIRYHSYHYNSDVKYYCDLQINKKTITKREKIKANDKACLLFIMDNVNEDKN